MGISHRSVITIIKKSEVILKNSSLYLFEDFEKEFPTSIPKVVYEAFTKQRRRILCGDSCRGNVLAGEYGDFSWIIKDVSVTFTLGKGDGMNEGSRHYREEPDEGRKSWVTEDKSYDKYGMILGRPMKMGDPGYDGPDRW